MDAEEPSGRQVEELDADCREQPRAERAAERKRVRMGEGARRPLVILMGKIPLARDGYPLIGGCLAATVA